MSSFDADGRDALVHFAAFGAVPYNLAYRLFDPHPVISLCDRRCGLVDTTVGLEVYRPGNLILPLCIRDNLLTF